MLAQPRDPRGDESFQRLEITRNKSSNRLNIRRHRVSENNFKKQTLVPTQEQLRWPVHLTNVFSCSTATTMPEIPVELQAEFSP